ncbi:MAG: AraC family transcriptional regulator, partial [Phenylobacterium sp.]
SGIDPQDLQDQDNRVPFARYIALMRAGQELCDDPALSLHNAEATDLSQISVVGLLAHASETIADSFIQLNRYGRLVADVGGAASGGRFHLEYSPEGVWMVDRRENPNDFPEFTESTFTRFAVGPRMFDQTPFVKAVHFTHPAPAYRDEYDRIFRAPVVFEAARNAMLIDKDWATHRVALTPRYVFGILSEHANALLKDLESSTSTRGRVESLLMPVLHTGEVNMDLIARKLGVSRQTLFRKLKAEGVTFVGVLDELRHKLAVHYLSGKKTSVNETAYLVGFSEPAAFSRAFKRWTGSSPRTMRAPKAANQ